MAVKTIRDRLESLGKKAQKLRDSRNMQWPEIAEELETGQGKVMLAYLCVTEPLVKAKNEDELRNKIAKMRKRNGDNLSWAVIAARVDRPESYCRSAYQDVTSTEHRGDRIGKGGRYPGVANGTGKVKGTKKAPAQKATKAEKAAKVAKAAKAKATAKKGGAKKSATGGRTAKTPASSGGLADMTLGELKDRLNGKAITVEDGDGKRVIKVKTISSLEDGEIGLTDQAGKVRAVKVEQITRATK
jgi:hypothetical protein